jgi:hypothetical protein
VCVCWNGVWKLCVLEWRVEEVVCVVMDCGNGVFVGMECEKCVSWNEVWKLCVLEKFESVLRIFIVVIYCS